MFQTGRLVHFAAGWQAPLFLNNAHQIDLDIAVFLRAKLGFERRGELLARPRVVGENGTAVEADLQSILQVGYGRALYVQSQWNADLVQWLGLPLICSRPCAIRLLA